MKITITAIAAATAIFGFTVGLLVGLSQSPVVGVILPVLFSVLGGTSGLYFAKLDFSSNQGQQAACLMSLSIFLMCLGTLGGVWLGMNMRVNPQSLVDIARGPKLSLLPEGTPADTTVQWMLLDAKLHFIGLEDSERRIVLDRIHTVSERYERELSAEAFNHEIEWLYKTFQEIMPPEEAVELREEWLRILRRLEVIHEVIATSKIQVKPILFTEDIAELNEWTTYLTDDQDDQAFLANHPDAAKTLAQAKTRIRNMAATISNKTSPIVEAHQQLDQFLETNSARFDSNDQTPSRGLANDDSQQFDPVG